MSGPGDTSATFCATLVDEWVEQGIVHAVVAPGSRSTPLAVALVSDGRLKVHVFHDERVAGFVALGIGRSTGVPAVLLCTSGTAAAHFVAPVHEANLSRVPMIVCTADRPPELRDVSAPQTIDQTKLYGSVVRWFHDPGVPSDDASSSWRSLARRAFSASVGATPGPVHLNLPFREPLLGRVGDLPARTGAVAQHTGLAVDADTVSAVAAEVNGRRGVIIAGRGAQPEVLELARALGWPVLADATSGLRNGDEVVVNGFDPVLRSTVFAGAHVPEAVIRVGDVPASKVMSQWITRSGARVFQVQDHGLTVDPDHAVGIAVTGPIGRACAALAELVTPCGADWMREWRTADDAAQGAVDSATAGTLSDISLARAVTRTVRAGWNLVVSSSMPIRDVEWFGAPTPGVTVHANRGANGIDGVVSTAIGVALATGKRTVVYIGDVAFLHDSTALVGLAARGIDMAVVVANNDGGSIFSFLPQAGQVDAQTFELLYGTPHGVNVASLAAAHGIRSGELRIADDVTRELGLDGTVILEFRSDRSTNVADHDSVNAAVVAAVESATA